MSGFNTSTRKDDVSLKLRTQNMRHTRDQTKKLEEESRRMEDRLRELKTAMSREKEERVRQGGGFWGRGQTNTGSLTSYASEVLQTKPEKAAKEVKKKKIRVLQDEPLDVPKRSSQPGTIGYLARRKLPSGSTPRDKQKGPKCGQCEERSASLSCVQCSEVYCAGCFAAFHMKGALKQHRSCPISANAGRVCMSPRPSMDSTSPRGSQASGSVVTYSKDVYPVDGSEASGPRSTPRLTMPRQAGGATLLQGDYNESDSAASFQEVLMAWRQGEGTGCSQASTRRTPRQVASPVKSPVVAIDTSTGMTEEAKVQEIKFKNSLSYVERLMLKKHRRTEIGETTSARLADQSGSSSQMSVQSNLSTDNHSRHHKENESRNSTASPSLNSSQRRQSSMHLYKGDKLDSAENSFISGGERVDFQSLYEAVVLSEESVMATPRSDYSIMDSSNSALPYDYPVRGQVILSSPFTEEVEPWPTRENYRREKTPLRKDSLPEKSNLKSKEPSQKEIFATGQEQSHSNSSDRLRNSPSFEDKTSIQKGRQNSKEFLAIGSTHDLTNEKRAQMDSDDVKLSKSRPASATSKTSKSLRSSKSSRPASRAQSRASLRMKPEEGVLTKTPSAALSQIASLAGETNASCVSYQSPLEGFFLAGVDLAGLNEQADGESSQKNGQRPKSRSGQIGGVGGKETMKVSYRLYQMAPRSWRPESSLGVTLPLDDVRVEDDNDDTAQTDRVLAYSYSGQMSGRPTEWRPTSSQSSNPPTPTNFDNCHLSSACSREDRDTTSTPTKNSSNLIDQDIGQGDSRIPSQNAASIPRNKSASRHSVGATTPVQPMVPSTPKQPQTFLKNSVVKTTKYPTSQNDNKPCDSNVKHKENLTSSRRSVSGKSRANQFVGDLLPSKSEIHLSQSKSQVTVAPDDYNSVSRSNTKTPGVAGQIHARSNQPSRPSSKNSTSGASVSRRHSDLDQGPQQRPSSARNRPAASSSRRNRPNSSTDGKGRSGQPAVVSQSFDTMEVRQDTVIADVMNTRVQADGWMAQEVGGDKHSDYDCSSGFKESKMVSDWETEVRPFTRDGLNSAKLGRGLVEVEATTNGEMDLPPLSARSGRESRAIVMDGEDLSLYDTAATHTEEQNLDDNATLDLLEWELASDTGRLTADGQVSRMSLWNSDEYSGSQSSSRSSSARSMRFCAERNYDLTSKLLEDERLAEQDFDNLNVERDMTLDEDDVKALR